MYELYKKRLKRIESESDDMRSEETANFNDAYGKRENEYYDALSDAKSEASKIRDTAINNAETLLSNGKITQSEYEKREKTAKTNYTTTVEEAEKELKATLNEDLQKLEKAYDEKISLIEQRKEELSDKIEEEQKAAEEEQKKIDEAKNMKFETPKILHWIMDYSPEVNARAKALGITL